MEKDHFPYKRRREYKIKRDVRLRIGFRWIRIAYDSERNLVNCDRTTKLSEWCVIKRLRVVRSKGYTDLFDTVFWNDELGGM
jgi:hypothetical protein